MEARSLTSEKILSQTIDLELTNGNDGRGGRWFSSAKVRKKIEETLRASGLVREPFEFPVRIHLTRVLGRGQRLWDHDSKLRGNSKELIDALVAVGWFRDDGPKYVTDVTASQDKTQRQNGPITIVEVYRG